ncbi:MAG: hypothetical protein RL477_1331 [Pseudomonadota bacterium]
MYHSGVVAGNAPASRTIIAAAAQTSRRAGAEALSGVTGADRIERRESAQYGRRAGDDATRAVVIGIEESFARPERRQGAPSSAFLAQHIAQEVEPEDPAFSAYQAGARAYVMRRDSTVEILAASGRLDIFV